MTQFQVRKHLDSHPGKEFQLLTLLVAACVVVYDDHAHDEEILMLGELCKSWGVDNQVVFNSLADDPGQTLVSVLEIAKRTVTPDGQRIMLEMAVMAAMADDKLVYGELLLLHLIADVFAITSAELKDIYFKITSNQLPERGDPSDPAYYTSREQKQDSEKSNGAGSDSGNRSQNAKSGNEHQHAQHYRTLGIEFGSTLSEIRVAYRRLAMIKHPDRFPNATEVEKRQLHNEFLNIKHAYDVLISAHG
ncbi:MAG: DnaJ domain-containing protein [Ignavibacteria bacterium]|nr:DnaJ domain-containing protein [Ignavibacteria bacterium]MBK9182190.1 DnaJ domain-containing protein [Ignavibacteria bacterium]